MVVGDAFGRSWVMTFGGLMGCFTIFLHLWKEWHADAENMIRIPSASEELRSSEGAAEGRESRDGVCGVAIEAFATGWEGKDCLRGVLRRMDRAQEGLSLRKRLRPWLHHEKHSLYVCR